MIMQKKPSDYFRALCKLQNLEQQMVFTVAEILDLDDKHDAETVRMLMKVEVNLEEYTKKLKDYVRGKIQEGTESQKTVPE